MTPALKFLDVVALLKDRPGAGLLRGQVGTVVEVLAPGIFEVEFSDAEGRPFAMVAVPGEQLMRLLHGPVESAVRRSPRTAKAAAS
jgi:hypothetical protein